MDIAFCQKFIRASELSSYLEKKSTFTTMLVEEGKFFFLQRHLQRMVDACTFFNIPFPDIPPNCFEDLIEKNRATQGKWRIKMVQLLENFSHFPLFITINPIDTPVPNKISLTLYPFPIETPYPKYKTWGYLPRKLLLNYALNKGCDDVILCNQQGHILETAIANIFWIKNGTFFYPDPSLPYLKGISLDIAIKVATSLQMPIRKAKCSLQDTKQAHFFYANSLKKILTVQRAEDVFFLYSKKLLQKFVQGFQFYANKERGRFHYLFP